MSNTQTGWRVQVRGEADTKERAIEIFEEQVTKLREENYKTFYSNGGCLGKDGEYLRFVLPPHQKPLDLEEISQLREILEERKASRAV